MTVDEFLTAYAAVDGRYELVDGVPVMMPGANARHNRVLGNLRANLYASLDNGPCEVFGADMALQVSEYDVRFPGAAIYCDPSDLAPSNDSQPCLHHPRVIFEIAAPSSATIDWLTRLIEYQQLPSVDTIVTIDPDRCTLTTYVRADGNAWTMTTHPVGAALRLRDPQVEISGERMFRRVDAQAGATAR